MSYPSVPYTILMDSGIQEGVSGEGPWAVVKFKCLTSDRYAFVQQLIGSTALSGGMVVRVFPAQYPPSPNLFCMTIDEIEQVGPGFQLGIFGGIPWIGRKYSFVTARFTVPPFSFDGSTDPSGEPYTTTTFGVGGEVLTLPDGAFTFPSGAPVTGSAAGMIIPQSEISIKRHWMPFVPVNESLSLVGKANNSAFSIGDFTCPTGTLLFLGMGTEIRWMPDGTVNWDVEYRMSYRSIPWNQIMNPNGTSGFQLVTDGSGNNIYAPGDFTSLP